jgi:hypothetical protein
VPCTTAPPPPTGLTVTGITMNSAILNWATQPGLYYSVDYKVAGSTNWINAAAGINTNTVTLNNLSASLTYDWRVGVNCSQTVINNYTVAQFNTVSHNSTLTNLKNGFGIKLSPNPVSGASIIDYIIPGSGKVTLSVKNAIGQQLAILFENSQSAGQYQLQLTNQLNKLNSGIYFLRVEQNGKSHSIKFLKK